MSYNDYEWSKKIALMQPPFYGIIMAAMRNADTDNLAALQQAFPHVWDELVERYRVPGGFLFGEDPERTYCDVGES